MIRGKEPLVSVLVVNFNGEKHISNCLNSIISNNYPNYEIIIVDDGSCDKSISIIQENFLSKYDFIKLVENDSNKGPSLRRNQGLIECRGKYIALLDNDTKVDPEWLNNAVKVLEKDPSLGGCQCKLMLDNSPKNYDYGGEYLGTNGFLVQRVPFGFKDDGSYDRVEYILGAKSAAAVLRSDAIRKAGFFDPSYFIYVEETDLCWRIWLAGYKIVFMPKSKVYHAFATTGKNISKSGYRAKFHGTKNYIRTLTKNLSAKNLAIMLPKHIVSWSGLSFYYLLTLRPGFAYCIWKGIAWNILHLPSTIYERKIIQKNRALSDKELFALLLRKKSLSYYINKIAMGDKFLRILSKKDNQKSELELLSSKQPDIAGAK